MALVLNDRVKETTTSTGTGTVNLAGAETGFETFVAGIGNTNTTYYAIVHQSAAEFEVGLGTVSDSSPDTLSRTTIISSSNSDSAVNFSAGTKDVFCTLPASKAVFIDGSGDLEFNAPGDDFSFKNSSNTIAFIKTDNNDFTIQNNLNDKDVIFKGYDSDGGGLLEALRIDYSAGGNIDIGSGTITRTGDLTLDVSNVIKLDADGAEIQIKDGGTEIGAINMASSNLNIDAKVADKDIVFRGIDGSSDVTALTLDMSEAGSATFNSNITLHDNKGVYFGAGSDLIIYSDGTDAILDASGDITLDADGEHIRFKDGGTEWGNIESGSNNFNLTVSQQDKDFLVLGNDGGSGITALTIDMSEAGAATFNNNVTAFSDERLKDNIETLTDGLDKVEQLRGVTYTRDERENIGVIAQEVEKILPEIVLTADDEMGTKSVDYSRLTAVLIEAVKDLSARVKELEDK